MPPEAGQRAYVDVVGVPVDVGPRDERHAAHQAVVLVDALLARRDDAAPPAIDVRLVLENACGFPIGLGIDGWV